MVEHLGCWRYFCTRRHCGPGRVQTNIFYLKPIYTNTNSTNSLDHPTKYILFKNGLSHNLVSRIGVGMNHTV